MDRALLSFGRGDAWTIRDACEGCQVFGQTGSGKTSGSGYRIAEAFLREGMGGLVLTAKDDERPMWEAWCRQLGRGDDVIVFDRHMAQRFNFLDYEMNRTGEGAGQTLNLAFMFQQVSEVAEKHSGGQSSEQRFWRGAMREMLTHAIDVVALSGEKMTLQALYDVISSAPRTVEEASNEAFMEKAYLMHCLREALARPLSPPQQGDLDNAGNYWFKKFPKEAPDTRSSIITTFTSMANSFMHSPFRELFCTDTTVTPEATFDGKIIIVDLPVLEHGELGQQAQIVWKFLWQQAAGRRPLGPDARPVFLWADEAQYFVTSNDTKFQSTSRSKRVCTVYLTQNLPSYLAELGQSARPAVESLLGNLGTKIFHMNIEEQTNLYAANLIGKTWQVRSNRSVTEQPARTMAEGLAPKLSVSTGVTESEEYQVPPIAFAQLLTGGPNNKRRVGAIICKGGRQFRGSGSHYLISTFQQSEQQ